MDGDESSSSACRKHKWQETNGICAFCLSERLHAWKSYKAINSSQTRASTGAAGRSARFDHANHSCSTHPSKDQLPVYSISDRASWTCQQTSARRGKLGAAGLIHQLRKNPKECEFDRKYHQSDSDISCSDLSRSHSMNHKSIDSLGKGSNILGGQKVSSCNRPASSEQIEARGLKSARKAPNYLWKACGSSKDSSDRIIETTTRICVIQNLFAKEARTETIGRPVWR